MRRMGRPRVWTDEVALNALRALAVQLGRVPTTRDVNRSPDCPSDALFKKRFGSVAAAFARAGLPRRKPGGQALHGRRVGHAARVARIDPDRARQITDAKKAYWRMAS